MLLCETMEEEITGGEETKGAPLRKEGRGDPGWNQRYRW